MSTHEPRAGSHSPWGICDHVDKLADGIIQVGTPRHGGIHLRDDLNAAMPDAFRDSSGWYEEDCDWALVALVYPHAFTEQAQASAHRTVMNWMPEAYEAWAGVVLQPGQSRKKDEAAFLAAHAQDWTVRSAFGSWHDSVPNGWVGVVAVPCALHRTAQVPESALAHFLVTEVEYNGPRDPGKLFFLCDPARHPVWDMDKPKDQQDLQVHPTDAMDADADEDAHEGPRP